GPAGRRVAGLHVPGAGRSGTGPAHRQSSTSAFLFWQPPVAGRKTTNLMGKGAGPAHLQIRGGSRKLSGQSNKSPCPCQCFRDGQRWSFALFADILGVLCGSSFWWMQAKSNPFYRKGRKEGPQRPQRNSRSKMEINVRRLSEVQIVQIRGALRLGPGVDSFSQTMDDALAAGDTRLVINFAEVPMIDSSGIGILVKAMASAKQRGGGVKLVTPSKFVVQT